MSPPFRRVLVANRGEIALRIIRACHDLDMEAVAVYSDADATAAHVRLSDAAVRLGPPPAAESYLRADLIVAAALATGADAIHPGYGFLSERASFAAAVEQAGIAFVGPDHRVIALLGDKLAARRVARAAGVPVLPGTLEPAWVRDLDEAQAFIPEAQEIGFPMFVKAAAGGGGRGMRRVERSEDLPAALVAGSREAEATFGDGAVYLEREVRPARHVEVQLLGDRAGTVVAVGERECSIQRRHQKLIEEAPAPGLDEPARRELHALAVRVGEAARLQNAATAEFLLDADGRSWFLEVNTRIQVEHGVTELVTGLDLVAEQFSLAAGRELSEQVRGAAARAATPAGHAIEVRLSAEDPGRDFAPAAGPVTRWVMPAGPGIRVDTAIESGERVPPEYDPLVAKVMAHAADRPTAIARLRRALDEVEVGGIQTTLPFHRSVVRDPAFRAGDLSTGWVDERWDGPAERAGAVRLALLAAGIAGLDGPGEAGSTGVRGDSALASSPSDGPAAGDPSDDRSTWRIDGRRAATDRWPR